MESFRISPTPPLTLNQFSTRSLREQPTRDTINAREYSRWMEDERVPVNAKISAKVPYYDMAPLQSRNQDRAQFQQAQPFIVDAPPFQENPYFAKYDITSDPRNTTRELRGAVTENNVDKDIGESRRLFARGFDTHFLPAQATARQVEKALEDTNFLRPQLNDMKTNYRKLASNQN